MSKRNQPLSSGGATLILVAAVLVMLFNFSAKTNKSARESVEEGLVRVAESYAAKVSHELVRTSDAGKPIGYLMKGHISSNKRFMVEMAESLRFNTQAYAVVYYARDEEALLHDGTKLDIRKTTYFEEVEKALQDVETKERTSKDVAVRYIYVTNDELGFGKEAIIAIISVDNEEQGDKLLLYYSTEMLKHIFNPLEFDGQNFYAIVDSEGMIIEETGVQSNFLKTGNIWDVIKQADPDSKEEVLKSTVRMRNRTTGSIEAVVDGEARTLVYAPTGINNWSVVIGVKQSYVDGILNKEWRNTKNMVYQLIGAIIVFLLMVVTINIINRVRSRRESQELEKKADTDLLTGLNNKLATERKIKEYIKSCPNEQALMFVLDIDNFKKINDTMGHAFGDEVLRSLGHSIGASFRATDVIGRAGGDEFIILLKNLKDEEILLREAKKLCDFFKDFRAGEYVKYAATASIGAAVFPADGKDFDALYKAADNALYVAKKRGKAQMAFYGDENNKSEGKKRVEAESRSRD